MTYQQAKECAIQLTGRAPRWCDVRDDDEFSPAPTPEAMDDCIAIGETGKQTFISYWHNQVPVSTNAAAVCYF